MLILFCRFYFGDLITDFIMDGGNAISRSWERAILKNYVGKKVLLSVYGSLKMRFDC